MSKNKAQGTAFETYIVRTARDHGLAASRLAEGGSSDGGDVLLGSTDSFVLPITVLAWKRLVPKQDKQRRLPDGEPIVFVLDERAFWKLVPYNNVVVECKATERLNVTRTLAKAKDKVKRWAIKNMPSVVD